MMEVYTKRRALQDGVAEQRKKAKIIGFVPTMGALHRGHASLIDYAFKKECDLVVVSIFVNPTQFNNKEDLQNYPRTLEDDLRFLSPYQEKLIVFAPQAEEVYGTEIKTKSYDFEGLDQVMEGAFRPGHFEGVATVLSHLFNIVEPDCAFFGEKDYQQLQIVKKLVAIEQLPVEIVSVPISRHEDGLAESSRNKRLTTEFRQAAPFIYQTLQEAKEKFKTTSIADTKAWVEEAFATHDLLKLEYFEIAEPHKLKPSLEKQAGFDYRGFIAVYAGDVRLIDTLALT